MSAIISSLDNYTPSQLGEKGFSEYTWSASITEQICQINFQLTRINSDNDGDNEKLEKLILKYKEIIEYLLREKTEENITYLSYLFIMVAQTRDIISGKGEYRLSYALINVWSEVDNGSFLHFALFAFKQFVQDNLEHPYGSWKDVKYFYKMYPNSPLIPHIITLTNEQLRKDLNSVQPTLLAKWIPREKSSFSELFVLLAKNYFSDYIKSSEGKNSFTEKRALNKAKMEYRKIISDLNKKLDTTQIKQCANEWAKIEPNNVTSITLTKQKKAFLNINSDGSLRHKDNEDRIECANNFKNFIEKSKTGEVIMKGKRVSIIDFVKNALSSNLSDEEVDLLNAQWKDNSSQNGPLGKMIAMVDVSGSMSGDPMMAAIGLGLRIAEKSQLGKRVLTFSASPQWVNLSNVDNFIDMVKTVQRADWGMNTNFSAALNMILDAIVVNKLSAEDVEDMVLVILSDMQMDQADDKYKNLIEFMETKYAETGIQVCGKPYKPPHILFWNLRSTSGFPTLSNQKNCSMMSGFSPMLLNIFCEEGMNALNSCTPWSLLIKSLENERYRKMEIFFKVSFCIKN
jgi:hypothetical protein